jgi:hypothetical protein
MSIPATMRALQQTSLSGPQDMRLITDAPVPSPGEGLAAHEVPTAITHTDRASEWVSPTSRSRRVVSWSRAI